MEKSSEHSYYYLNATFGRKGMKAIKKEVNVFKRKQNKQWIVIYGKHMKHLSPSHHNFTETNKHTFIRFSIN